MKEMIKFKPVYLSKLINITLSFGVGFSIICFLLLKLEIQIIFCICSLFVFSLILYSFYLNRFDLDCIFVEEDSVTFYFVNKFLFQKKPLKCKISQLKVVRKNDDSILKISMNLTIIAIFRKKATEENKWEQLKKVFI